jgi:hypothetical protein
LKRARDSTVSDAMMPKRRKSRRAPSQPSPVAEALPPAPRARWIARSAFAAVTCALLVAGGVWIAHTRSTAGTIAPRYAVAATDSGEETIKAAATTATVATPPVAAPADKSGAARLADGDDAATRTLDARSLPSSITMPRGNPHTDALAASATAGVVAAPPSAPHVDAPLPPPIVVAQAPARPAPDRWQRLADSLANCPADVIARTMCQETLRIEHCDGYWGRVAACPAKVEREYGN